MVECDVSWNFTDDGMLFIKLTAKDNLDRQLAVGYQTAEKSFLLAFMRMLAEFGASEYRHSNFLLMNKEDKLRTFFKTSDFGDELVIHFTDYNSDPDSYVGVMTRTDMSQLVKEANGVHK